MDSSTAIIIAAIITLIGSLFGGIAKYYIKQRKKTERAPGTTFSLSSQEARKTRIKRVAASVLLAGDFLFFIFLGVCAWFSFVYNTPAVHNAPAPCSKNAGASLMADYPTNKLEVYRVTTMYGTACNLAKGQHAWPIALAETSNVYYVLGSEIPITDAQTWSTVITLGDTSESVIGHPYMVSVIIVNDAINAMLNSIISKPHVMHTIAHIPFGAQIMFRITLIRK